MTTKPPRLPYLRIWVDEYIAGTRSLSPAERGVYFDLLLFSWARGGALPKEPKALARMLGVSLRQFVDAWDGQVREKFEETAEGMTNARLERERADALAKREKASERAAKAAGGRWKRAPDPDAPSIKNDAPSMSRGDASSITGDAWSMRLRSRMLEQCPPTPTPTPTIRTPDSEADSARKRARPAGPRSQRARRDGNGQSESAEVRHRRKAAAEIAAQIAREKAMPK